MNASDLMTRELVKCSPYDSTNDAVRLMWECDIGCLPVVNEDGDTVGMITDRDICMAVYTRGLPLTQMSVESVMSKSVIGCVPEATFSEVEALMRLHQIRRLPVISRFGELMGIITMADLARHATHGIRGAVASAGVAKTIAAVCEHRHNAAA